MPAQGDSRGAIGIIGLGNMGGRIARRLLAAGYGVIGYDVQPSRVPGAARAADDVASLAGDVDIVLMSLPDSSVVEAVVLGDGGVLAHCCSGQVVVDLSTAAPSSSLRLHAMFGERGVEFIDAGISGGAAAAEAGTLTIMAGGSVEALERVRWALEPFSGKVFHVGEAGAGHTVKLLNNFLNAVSLAATAEVMVAARKAGLDLPTVLEVLNAGSGVNFATLNRFPHIVRGDYLEGGLTGALMLKDVQLYVEHVASLGVPSLNASGPIAAFGLANSLGYRDQISNRVVDAIGDIAGGVRVSEPDPTRTKENR
ncbi:MAG: NAD(P)-dependent oxidoreductase [Solirubrobacterales bacterium]|nr:NAD(P)-dependent oxidoreductase [Solirubrobacterales bacterium]